MKSIKKNLIYNILYQLLLVILPLATAPYISRKLGAEAIGIYSYTYSIANYFLIFAMLGISNHGNRSIAINRDNINKRSKSFINIYFIQFITFAISIICYIIYTLFFVKENNVISWLQLAFLISGLFDISWLYFGLEEFKTTVTRSFIVKIITFISIFIFVKKPDDLWKYTIIYSFGALFSQIYLWFNIKKYIKFVKPDIGELKKNIMPILILFIPVIAYSVYKIMDKVMLGSMVSKVQVGYYESSEKIINIPVGVITAFGTVMLPRMSNLISNADKEKAFGYIRLSFKAITIIATAISFGLMGISDVLAPVFFGEEFKSCSIIIELLSISVFFVSWANIIRTQYLIPKKMDRVYVLSTITGAVVNLILNLLLIPKLAAVGAAIGTVAAEFSVLLIQVIFTEKNIHSIKVILKQVPYIIFGFLMFCITKLIGKVLGISLVTLIIQIILGATVFCVLSLIYIIFFDSEKKEYILDIYNKIKKKITSKKFKVITSQ